MFLRVADQINSIVKWWLPLVVFTLSFTHGNPLFQKIIYIYIYICTHIWYDLFFFFGILPIYRLCFLPAVIYAGTQPEAKKVGVCARSGGLWSKGQSELQQLQGSGIPTWSLLGGSSQGWSGYTPVIQHSNRKWTIGRWISYIKWGFSIAMLV